MKKEKDPSKPEHMRTRPHKQGKAEGHTCPSCQAPMIWTFDRHMCTKCQYVEER